MNAIKITWGPAEDYDGAPNAWRFYGTPFALKYIFNDITRGYQSASERFHRFYWNAKYKFWYTESCTSKDQAIREFNNHGAYIYPG